MIRTTLLWALIAFGCVYAFTNWFRALLLLILLMAVYQHPDMPRSLAGIPGMNPWNLLMLFVGTAWFITRQRDGYSWDFPPGTMTLLLINAVVLLFSSTRAIRDPITLAATSHIYGSMGALFGDLMVNTFKWMVLPILLFDGCRDERRLKEALWTVLAVFTLIALQVVKYMPPQYAIDGDALQYRAIRVLEKGVGYHRVNLSVMLAGASWALFCTRVTIQRGSLKWLLSSTCLLIVYAQGMTAGRAGYLTWALIGLTLCVVKWRKYLIAVPVVAAAIVFFVPAVSERMLAGFSEESRDSNVQVEQYQASRGVTLGEDSGVDAYTITSGRSFMWPFVIAKIQESPWIGYGREAMLRTGLTLELWNLYGEVFPHPHNAYLQLLLDGGLVGFVCVMPFYLLIAWRSFSLFRDNTSPLYVAAGGACLATVLSLLFGAVGSQSFYPREGWVGMWCLIGVMLRIHHQRAQLPKAQALVPSPRLPASPLTRLSPHAVPVAAQRTAAAPPTLDELLWPAPVRPSSPWASTAAKAIPRVMAPRSSPATPPRHPSPTRR
jgi:O-antigen ligase